MKRCRYCGMRSASGLRQIGNRHQFECRNETACFNRVLAQLDNAKGVLRRVAGVGGLMANACFNLSREARAPSLHPSDRTALGELRKSWDALRAEVNGVIR